MSDITTSRPSHERFNNLCPGSTLDRFGYFELVACRVDRPDDCVVQCGAAEAEFWAIYGREPVVTDGHLMYMATAVHDVDAPFEAVRIARQIAIETGKGFLAGDTVSGLVPNRTGIGLWPVNDFAEIADRLLYAIVDDLDPGIDGLPPGGDTLDHHPLTALQQAFLAFSDHPGSTQLDPYDTAACEAFRNG